MNKEIEAKINSSGNSFHFQVCNYIKNKTWNVEIGNYYTDFESNKSREIDIVTKKNKKISGEDFFVNLFIECKYCADDIVFWFDSKNIDKTKSLIMKDFIFNEDFDELNSGCLSNLDLFQCSEPDRKSIIRNHYIIQDDVAKLFTDGSNKLIYTSLNQVLNSLIFFTEYDRNSYHEISFPIILINSFDKFYDQNGKCLKNLSNFQIEVNYSYLSGKEKHPAKKYFLIDIVNFEKIDEFLLLLDKDISKTSESIECSLYRDDNSENN